MPACSAFVTRTACALTLASVLAACAGPNDRLCAAMRPFYPSEAVIAAMTVEEQVTVAANNLQIERYCVH